MKIINYFYFYLPLYFYLILFLYNNYLINLDNNKFVDFNYLITQTNQCNNNNCLSHHTHNCYPMRYEIKLDKFILDSNNTICEKFLDNYLETLNTNIRIRGYDIITIIVNKNRSINQNWFLYYKLEIIYIFLVLFICPMVMKLYYFLIEEIYS